MDNCFSHAKLHFHIVNINCNSGKCNMSNIAEKIHDTRFYLVELSAVSSRRPSWRLLLTLVMYATIKQYYAVKLGNT